MTRELWLEELIEKVRPIYEDAKVPIPEKVRVSFGWPSKNALGTKSRRMGECWVVEAAEDGVNQIFLSPLMSNAEEAAGVLAHELIHAALPSGCGHKGKFKAACKAVGVTDGPAKSAMPGPELREKISQILSNMEPYPHVALVPKSADKKQSTRMRKLQCTDSSHEPYILRGSKKTTDLGIPDCPICREPMHLDDADEDNGEKEEK